MALRTVAPAIAVHMIIDKNKTAFERTDALIAKTTRCRETCTRRIKLKALNEQR